PVWNELASAPHRRWGDRAKKAWDRSFYAADTRNRKSKYTPYLSRSDIERIEMECVLNQSVREGELTSKRCDVRLYFRRFSDFVGACRGKKVCFIVVVHESDGSVHGYPADEKYLRHLGAQI